MSLTKAAFLSALTSFRREHVALPDGSTVYVRELSAADRNELVATATAAKEDGGKVSGFQVRAVVLTACDADGNRLFGDADTAAVSAGPASVIDVVFGAAAKLNGMTAKEDDAAKN
ncbi:MAG: hypothetical protein JWO31_3284 [Phycisphaerales bacterium]|nr:hypothetical protein [Phycisphaerales bacterium]